MFPEHAIRDEQFNYLLHILQKNDDDLKKTIIELNKYHHYQLNNVDDYINKVYEVKQFISNHCLYDAQKHFKKELKLIDETYSNKRNENH
ncbi:hypothetical protein L5D95_10315 [Streptococcus pneumoniae]|nr:hypothetical protein [Streptococcus pneumoniae]